MAFLSDVDREKRDQLLKKAAHADYMALKTHSVIDRGTWEDIAASYREMADRISRNFKP